MEGFEKQVATRLPLGEAVLRLFDFVCQEEFLDGVFERHRGRSYEDKIKFPLIVQLIADALLEHDDSSGKSFPRAEIKAERKGRKGQPSSWGMPNSGSRVRPRLTVGRVNPGRGQYRPGQSQRKG